MHQSMATTESINHPCISQSMAIIDSTNQPCISQWPSQNQWLAHQPVMTQESLCPPQDDPCIFNDDPQLMSHVSINNARISQWSMHKQLPQNQWPKYHLLNLQQSVFINDPRSYKRPTHKSSLHHAPHRKQCPLQPTALHQLPMHLSMTPTQTNDPCIHYLHTGQCPLQPMALHQWPVHLAMTSESMTPTWSIDPCTNQWPLHQSRMTHALMTHLSTDDLYIN